MQFKQSATSQTCKCILEVHIQRGVGKFIILLNSGIKS